MNSPDTPVPRLVAIDRRQLLLRTVDVEKLVEDGHAVRSIWELVRRLDLRWYHAQIAAVEGGAGREHTDPQLLISLWLYPYSRGISSARELARRCEYEPGCQWLCGLQPVSHRTLSGFRSDKQGALDDLFTQVLGMLSAEGLITLKRVTLDGTKIKANAGANSFRRQEKIAVHLAAAREHHSDGGLALSYNAQISTDAAHGLVVGVGVTQAAEDNAQLLPGSGSRGATVKEKDAADGDALGFTYNLQHWIRLNKLRGTAAVS
jgi:transposase